MSRIKKMLLFNVIGVVAIFVITLVSKNTFKLEAALSGLPNNEYLMHYDTLDSLPFIIAYTILVLNIFDLILLLKATPKDESQSLD